MLQILILTSRHYVALALVWIFSSLTDVISLPVSPNGRIRLLPLRLDRHHATHFGVSKDTIAIMISNGWQIVAVRFLSGLGWLDITQL